LPQRRAVSGAKRPLVSASHSGGEKLYNYFNYIRVRNFAPNGAPFGLQIIALEANKQNQRLAVSQPDVPDGLPEPMVAEGPVLVSMSEPEFMPVLVRLPEPMPVFVRVPEPIPLVDIPAPFPS
jgi:hypothetical protein